MTMWEKIKELYTGGILIGVSILLLVQLIGIELKGSVVIFEPNKWILRSEIGVVSLTLILAIERLIKDWE